jgi:hypothetical protein
MFVLVGYEEFPPVLLSSSVKRLYERSRTLISLKSLDDE